MKKIIINEEVIINDKEKVGSMVITLAGIFASMIGVFVINGYVVSRVVENVLMIN